MERIILETTAPSEAIATACSVLAAGGLILFPTETTYGAGVDATNPEAVQKLLRYKSRREGKPLSIAVTDEQMASKYVEINEQAHALYKQFLPGPMTVISHAKDDSVAPGVASEFGTLGVRIPDLQFMLDLVAAYGKPITATSANASGKARPYNIDSCLAELSNKQRDCIDLILDAGILPPNPPSTVIDTTLSTPVVFRGGSLQNEQLVTELTSHSAEETQAIAGKFLLKNWNAVRSSGLIVGLDGSLGVGKTVFTQGAAKFLSIAEQLSSPTYTYIEEYEFSRHGATGKLYHLDLWKIESESELERLEINQLLRPNSIIMIEWFALFQAAITKLAKLHSIPIVQVEISDEDLPDSERKLRISNTSPTSP